MRINSKYLVIFALFTIIISLTGCASWPKRTTSTDAQAVQEVEKSLSVASVLRFDDLPIPRGFKIIQNESVAFQNDSSRFAFLKYKGSATPDQTVLFFKEQMPLYNWDLVNLIEYGTKVMNFEKQDEACTVTIEGSAYKSIVMVSLTPKASGLAARQAPRSRK